MTVTWPSDGLAAGVEPAVIDRMLRAARPITAKDGEVLGHPRDESTTVFWVCQGGLSIHLREASSKPIAIVPQGHCAGDLAALHGTPRSAYIVAHGVTEAYEIPARAFLELIRTSHQAALNLLMMEAGRVRASSAAILDTTRERDAIKRNAVVDPLTNLLNRRWIDQMLPRLLERAHRDGSPLSVVLADVDNFKRFNDNFGHAAGDRVLAHVGLEMRRRFRPGDHVCRYGGEEFVAILPDADAAGAVQAAERLREALEFTGIVMPDGQALPQVTISAGVAEARPDDTPSDVLQRADHAMYDAKRTGRNRVCVAGAN